MSAIERSENMSPSFPRRVLRIENLKFPGPSNSQQAHSKKACGIGHPTGSRHSHSEEAHSSQQDGRSSRCSPSQARQPDITAQGLPGNSSPGNHPGKPLFRQKAAGRYCKPKFAGGCVIGWGQLTVQTNVELTHTN